MSRILVNGEWFDRLSPKALYEKEYERIILQQGQNLYPYHHILPFTTLVYDGEDSARSDLALVDREYREWWVVEVEKGIHSFESHVLKQVKTLANAVYGQSTVDAICSEMPDLDVAQVRDMLKGSQPRVLVLVDQQKPKWSRPLKAYNAVVGVIEIYRSSHNHHVFRVGGEHPSRPLSVVTKCRVDPVIRTLVKVDSPASLQVTTGNRIHLKYEGEISEWQRIDSQDAVWLSPIGHNPFSLYQEYQILRSDDGDLIIRST